MDDLISFSKIDSFEAFINIEGGYCEYTVTGDNHFEAIFVCPKPSMEAFNYVVVLDGYFLKTHYNGQLLLAVGIDTMDQLILLAYAIVGKETKDNWKWFLECFKAAMGLREDDKLTFISDRHIGLIDGFNSEFSSASHGFCIRHICENIKNHFKDHEIEKYFMKAAYTTSTDVFDEIMKQLGEYNGDALTYFEEIGKEHWAISAFSGSRFGHITKNVAESFNSLFLETREKPHLHVLVDIYLYCMNKYYERKSKEISGINFYNQ